MSPLDTASVSVMFFMEKSSTLNNVHRNANVVCVVAFTVDNDNYPERTKSYI